MGVRGGRYRWESRGGMGREEYMKGEGEDGKHIWEGYMGRVKI